MAAKFEVYKTNAGKFSFQLRSSNGQVVATGGSYDSLARAKKAIETVRRNAADATVVEA